jgi:mannose-6-phosphate isomerase-like protein (cupin superfamily)
MEDSEVKDTPHKVDVRNLLDTEHAQIVHILLKPGESLKKHVTPVDAAFYVLEGTPTIEIGDEKEVHGKDTLIESPARIIHTIRNESQAIARVLVIKTPRPKEASKVL